MLGVDSFIVNNILTKDGVDYKIFIDFGFIINLQDGSQIPFRLEETGVTINGNFKLFRNYVFAIQNNTIQYSDMCFYMSNIQIASNHVRIEKNNIITHCAIIDNTIINYEEEDFLEDYNIYQRDIYGLNETNDLKQNTNELSLEKISNDSQNVHETVIIKKFEIIYKKMLNLIERNCDMDKLLSFKISDSAETLIEKSFYCSDMKKLIMVLDYCVLHNGYIYNIGDRECNILRNIIIYILKCINTSSQDDIFLILAENIIDCVENNSIVCLTGRVIRMINAIQHTVEEHLEKRDKYSSIKDAKKDMLTYTHELFKKGMSIEKIKDCIAFEWNFLDKSEIYREIDSWCLEDLV